MKQRVIIAVGLFVTLLVLEKSGVLDAMLIFLLAGVIPGTGWSLSAGFMLSICALTLGILTLRLSVGLVVDTLDLRRRTKRHVARKTRMPKKRFLQLGR